MALRAYSPTLATRYIFYAPVRFILSFEKAMTTFRARMLDKLFFSRLLRLPVLARVCIEALKLAYFTRTPIDERAQCSRSPARLSCQGEGGGGRRGRGRRRTLGSGADLWRKFSAAKQFEAARKQSFWRLTGTPLLDRLYLLRSSPQFTVV